MSEEAKRDNSHKPDLSLLPYCFEVAVAKVMQFGAKKYGRFNYLKGHTVSGLVASAKRHLGKINAGEDIDEESGMSHWALVAANALMAIHQAELGTLKDDRYVRAPAAGTEPPAKLLPEFPIVFQVVATTKHNKVPLIVATYPDKKVAEHMKDKFHKAHWPEPAYTLTVEEVKNGPEPKNEQAAGAY